MHQISRRLEFFYKKGKLLFLIMLAGGKKKACGRKVPMGLPRLPFAKANFGYYCIGINGQDQMTVAILLLFESLKKYQRFKLCVIRRNKVSFKTKIMRIHPHPSTRNGKKETGITRRLICILVVPEPGRVLMPVSNNQKESFCNRCWVSKRLFFFRFEFSFFLSFPHFSRVRNHEHMETCLVFKGS
jgi:hypothetical protein